MDDMKDWHFVDEMADEHPLGTSWAIVLQHTRVDPLLYTTRDNTPENRHPIALSLSAQCGMTDPKPLEALPSAPPLQESFFLLTRYPL